MSLGNNIFPVAYKKYQGEFVTKAQYLTRKKAAIQKKRKATIARKKRLRKLIESLPDVRLAHSYAYPDRECQPTHEELASGIPVCCNGEPMKVSVFDKGLWWCRSCNKRRMR